MGEPLVIQATVLHDFYVQVLTRIGVPEADAHLAAAVRLEGALRLPAGLDAFSVIRLQNTVRRIQAGGINPTPSLSVVQEQASVALLDGDNGLGAVVGTQAMDYCLRKVRQHGFALVGMRHSTTLEMLAYYAMRALKRQIIGFVATNTELKIGLPPWGGLTPALGNNPFAIAIPGGQGPPLVLDMSVIATRPQGAAGEGLRPAPTQSRQGETSARGPIGSDFLPRPVIGEHKGYGLALILEVLTGVLTGAGFGQDHAPERLDDPEAQHNLGHLFGALDPTLFMPFAQFGIRLDRLRTEIKQGRRAPGVERLLLPGELEHERHETRLRHGIPVHADTPDVLRTFCATLGLDSPLAS